MNRAEVLRAADFALAALVAAFGETMAVLDTEIAELERTNAELQGEVRLAQQRDAFPANWLALATHEAPPMCN